MAETTARSKTAERTEPLARETDSFVFVVLGLLAQLERTDCLFESSPSSDAADRSAADPRSAASARSAAALHSAAALRPATALRPAAAPAGGAKSPSTRNDDVEMAILGLLSFRRTFERWLEVAACEVDGDEAPRTPRTPPRVIAR